ncbi:MAG: hypothetical protein B6I31_03410 [Desulfobacteraceae bacterium 4572_19]|nr:MAG: hypothetical protein B6I31_03410 [Desulfobacteraceae bacterium 4572_19]
MTKIHLLSESLINKIAAGEVIERPASVIKELVENSLDANSQNVKISIENSGFDFIEIVDDGDGISDVEKAILRHATSKLNDENDLYSINTLGFRGEALASICEIAKVEIITRTMNDSCASKTVIEGGKVISKTSCAGECGTIIRIRDIFYNTPARRKFLKSSEVEKRHCVETSMKLALCKPEIGIKLFSNDREVFSLRGQSNIKNKLIPVLGKEATRALIPISHKTDMFDISGFIAKPYITRNDKDKQFSIINERTVRSKIITQAVKDAFHTMLFLDKEPVFVIYVKLDPRTCDVNVHPTKYEIRIEHEKELYEAIMAACKKTFMEYTLIPDVEINANEYNATIDESISSNNADTKNILKEEQTVLKINKPTNMDLKNENSKNDENINHQNVQIIDENIITDTYQINDDESFNSVNIKNDNNTLTNNQNNNKNINNNNKKKKILNKNTSQLKNDIYTDESSKNDILSVDNNEHLTQSNISNTSNTSNISLSKKHNFKVKRVLGQIHKLYILVESIDGLLIIDQHAAEEKVLFEKYMKQFKDKSVIKQELLLPFIIELSQKDIDVLHNNIDVLISLGFEMQDFGNNEIRVDTIPQILGKLDKKFFEDTLSQLDKISKGQERDKVEHKIASMACRSAIKSGDELTIPYMKKLIDEMEMCDKPYSCPHGRPTIINITTNELEKKFKRK